MQETLNQQEETTLFSNQSLGERHVFKQYQEQIAGLESSNAVSWCIVDHSLLTDLLMYLSLG